MEKEKLIHWRNVHSPLLYDLARHIDGAAKYWDVSVKELGESSSKIERVESYLESVGIEKSAYLLVKIVGEEGMEDWERHLKDGKWNLSLRSEGFGLLFYKPQTERQNLVLGGRLRFFNA
ncbi:MAG: hypothetical protein CL847_01490 [Crocinitomicaceae bacterium]|nr:hypothetical protein [Crocinitomicaceae bacterium]|tara:strand:- start:16635 stop:16994 length:360 start_codon:yes stop_codon:yes gene_type:complete